MKRSHVCVWILLCLSLLFPVIVLLTKLLHVTLKVENGLFYAAITTAVYDAVSILLLSQKDKSLEKAYAPLLAVLLLLNQINVLLFLGFAEHMVAKLLVASWFITTAVVVAVYVRSAGLKIIFYTLSGILVQPICLFILLSDLGANTVLVHEASPDKTYCAEVIDDDQGALGGATQLNVYQLDGSFSIGSFSFRKGETTIYSGRWGEYNSESLRWNDDEHLVFNNTTYSMTDYFP